MGYVVATDSPRSGNACRAAETVSLEMPAPQSAPKRANAPLRPVAKHLKGEAHERLLLFAQAQDGAVAAQHYVHKDCQLCILRAVSKHNPLAARVAANG